MPADTPPPSATTLVDLLREQAGRYDDKVAFRFAPDGDDEYDRLTFSELDQRARAIAAQLQQQGAAGQRVLLICRPGLHNAAGFFGCVYAGAIAVPVNEHLPRLSLVVPDADADFALAATDTQDKVRTAVDELAGRPLRWCATDRIDTAADTWHPPAVDADSPALVQYTSGSTKSPKGTVVSHANLLHNLEAIRQAWDGNDQAVALYWLPQHHDMGLIGAVLEMVYVGCTTVLMSPTSFITRPMRWLQAMSRYRATFTTAPNFAYDKCVDDTTAKQRAELDLSSLTVAMNGAEPVRPATLQKFSRAFGKAGFAPRAFMPVYGLAEATLLVSGGSTAGGPTVRHLDRTALGEDWVVETTAKDSRGVGVVGCGQVRGDQRVVIVDPETRRERQPNQVGEIWIAGPSVAQGYLHLPKETERTFGAHIAGTGDGPFLRTGDLGFLRDGELFVTGRVKDLIVIRGAKYYPNDIEATVQDTHPVLLSGRGAVFSVPTESGGAERLVVVQEVERDPAEPTGLTDLVDVVRAAVTERHGIEPSAVLLVAKMTIPTTSSGKIQRQACRQRFLDGELEPLAEWHAPPSPDDTVDAAAPVPSAEQRAATANVVDALKVALALRAAAQQPGSRRRR